MPRDVWGWRGEEDDVGLEVGVVEGGQGGRLDVQHANLVIHGFCLQYFSDSKCIFHYKTGIHFLLISSEMLHWPIYDHIDTPKHSVVGEINVIRA